MKPFSPFSHQRDESLGRVLRDLLTPDDHDAFVERVLARAAAQPIGSGDGWLDVLGSWARPGVAAAVVLAVLGLFAFVRPPSTDSTVALEDTLHEIPDQDERSSFLVATEPPDFDVILASGELRPNER